MKQLCKMVLFVLAFPLLAMANNPEFNGKHTKEKTIHKEYNVNADANLSVNNSYGNIDIVTWNENRIVIDVMIRTNGNNEEKVTKKLEDINVEFSASASQVSAKTIFNKKSGWNLWGDGNNNVKMEINYTIKMPRSNSVDLSNDYGGINLTELDGKAKINCDYGQINIDRLMASENSLNFDYTKHSTIGYMKSGSINADYSDFTIDRGENLVVNADYTQTHIKEVQELTYNNDYGKITVDKVAKLTGRGDYIPLQVGSLSEGLMVNSDYGSITIDRVLPSTKDVSIKSDYAGIKLGFDTNWAFDFTIDLSYASLKGEEDLEMMKSHVESTSKHFSGFNKSKNSGNTVNIKSDYGGVTLTKK